MARQRHPYTDAKYGSLFVVLAYYNTTYTQLQVLFYYILIFLTFFTY